MRYAGYCASNLPSASSRSRDRPSGPGYSTTASAAANTATGEDIETYEQMSRDAACAKVEACHEAFLDWKTKSLEERAQVIK